MAEKKSVLTLNLGSQRVGMARFGVGSKGTLLLKNYAVQEMPGDPTQDNTRQYALTDAVKALTSSFKAGDSAVTYSVPGQFLIAKFVKLPPLAEDQVDKIVGFEAQQAVPFPLNETVWDYQLMGNSGGEVEVGIVAIRTEHLTDLNAAVEASKLHPTLVDGAPVALYNAFRYNYPDAEGCSLLIDFGARTTNLIFIEGHRAFISSFQTGGASITQAIAKEMEMDYDTAEGRKVNEGFVNLGGNYADHEDPEVDAMSKVIRNALLRVHGEVTRRTNAYRSQQGGSAPANIYLAGGGASLPYLKEVFEEKMRVPVHYFNPLRNVAVGPKVNAELAGAEAHTLGELVGLALREMACPMELDLSPAAIKAAKDVGSRKPRLFAAAAALFAALGGIWIYNSSATKSFEHKTEALTQDVEKLEKYASQIRAQEDRQKKEEARLSWQTEAVAVRSYWVNLINKLSAQLTDDKIWLTQISPLNARNEPLTTKLFSDAMEGSSFKNGASAGTTKTKGTTEKVDALYITGINRSDDVGAVSELIVRIRENMKDFVEFDPKVTDDTLRQDFLINDSGSSTARDGYMFQMKLPLKRKFEVDLEQRAK